MSYMTRHYLELAERRLSGDEIGSALAYLISAIWTLQETNEEQEEGARNEQR